MVRAPRPATLNDAKIPLEVLTRFDRVRSVLVRAQGAVSRGRTVPTETRDRLEKFAAREELLRQRQAIEASTRATAGLEPLGERIIGRDDILRVGFLARGMLAARAVAKLVVAGGGEHGSGFLVSPDALITNHHVLPDRSRALATEVEFELYDQTGTLAETRRCELDPQQFWFSDSKLDITVVALSDQPETVACTEGLGWHPMISQQGKIRIGDPVNIVQHPGGRAKSVVLHNSNLLHLQNDGDLAPFIWYSSDTEPGSSGAPVFNNHWEVIGVHHRSIPRTNSAGEIVDEQGRVIPRKEFLEHPNRAVWIANQGVRTSYIVAALKRADFQHDAETHFRDALLKRWEGSWVRNRGQMDALRFLQGDPSTEAHVIGNRIGARRPVTVNITIKWP